VSRLPARILGESKATGEKDATFGKCRVRRFRFCRKTQAWLEVWLQFRLDIFPATLVASVAVELLPALRLHGDAARHGRSAFGVFALRAFGAARSFARAAVGGFGFHFNLQTKAPFVHPLDLETRLVFPALLFSSLVLQFLQCGLTSRVCILC